MYLQSISHNTEMPLEFGNVFCSDKILYASLIMRDHKKF